MLRLIRFLDYFGGVAMATGLLWLYTLYRRGDGLTGIMPTGFDQPLTALSVVLVGIVMVITARIVTAYVRMQAKRMATVQAK